MRTRNVWRLNALRSQVIRQLRLSTKCRTNPVLSANRFARDSRYIRRQRPTKSAGTFQGEVQGTWQLRQTDRQVEEIRQAFAGKLRDRCKGNPFEVCDLLLRPFGNVPAAVLRRIIEIERMN
jgi:hypothetical protein